MCVCGCNDLQLLLNGRSGSDRLKHRPASHVFVAVSIGNCYVCYSLTVEWHVPSGPSSV